MDRATGRRTASLEEVLLRHALGEPIDRLDARSGRRGA